MQKRVRIRGGASNAKGEVHVPSGFEKDSLLNRKTFMSHEVAHICAGAKKEFPLNVEIDSIQVQYVEGFSLISVPTDPEDPESTLSLTNLEEGYATVAANNLTGGPSKADLPYYKAVSSMFNALLDFADLTIEDVHIYHKNSDIIGFTAALLGKNPENVTGEDVLWLLQNSNPAGALSK